MASSTRRAASTSTDRASRGRSAPNRAPIRSNDLYYGGSTTDWVDLTKVAVPQADEQQRLLANLITHMNLARKPLRDE